MHATQKWAIVYARPGQHAIERLATGQFADPETHLIVTDRTKRSVSETVLYGRSRLLWAELRRAFRTRLGVLEPRSPLGTGLGADRARDMPAEFPNVAFVLPVPMAPSPKALSPMQGRLFSSRNGLRHGILVQTVVLDDEDSELFATSLSTLEKNSAPVMKPTPP